MSVKAYVLRDGEVVSKSYLDRYATKQESKQLPPDRFEKAYDADGLMSPLYNLEMLAQLLEFNTYHYRACKTKARDTVGLGWRLKPVEGKENPNEEQRKRGYALFNNVHPFYPLGEILDKAMVDYEATGNGYIEIIRHTSGNIVGMDHIPSHTMRRHRDSVRYQQRRGLKKRWFKALGYPEDVDVNTGEITSGLSEENRANEVLHIYNYTSRSDYYGIPDILPSLGAILGDVQRQEYNIDFFENHAVPAYAVTVAGADLDEQTEQTIKRFFQEDLKENRHSTLVLTAEHPDDPNGKPVEFKFEALSVDVKEASFRLYRKDNRDEILSAHGVPKYRAGIAEEGSLGGSIAEEATKIYKQSVINPRQEMLEDRINRFILPELEITDWVFKFNEIDTRDEEQEEKRIETDFRMGALTPNELREARGRERVEGVPAMDYHYINGQPVELIGSAGGNQQSVEELLKAVKYLREELIKTARKEGADSG